MENSFGQRLSKLRQHLQFSVTEMANKLGFPKSSISRYERDINKPSIDILKSILKTFDANINWLLDGRGSMFLESDSERILATKTIDLHDRWQTSSNYSIFTENEILTEECVSLPLYGEIAAGQPVAVLNNSPLDQVDIPARFIQNTPEDWFVFKINGKSMQPQIQHEDIVFVKRSEDWEQLNNRIVAVRIDAEITLKKLQLDPQHGVIVLVAFNPDYETIIIGNDDFQDVTLIGEMKSIRRTFKKVVN